MVEQRYSLEVGAGRDVIENLPPGDRTDPGGMRRELGLIAGSSGQERERAFRGRQGLTVKADIGLKRTLSLFELVETFADRFNGAPESMVFSKIREELNHPNGPEDPYFRLAAEIELLLVSLSPDDPVCAPLLELASVAEERFGDSIPIWSGSSPDLSEEHNLALSLPLLDYPEEAALAKRIEAGRAAEKKRRQTGVISSEEVLSLEMGKKAVEVLIKRNSRMVEKIAFQYCREGVLLEDLIQEGNLGLLKAIEGYDYRLGWRFSTYACWKIRHKISRAFSFLGKEGDSVRNREKLKVIQEAEGFLFQRLGREPTPEELAEETGLESSVIALANQRGLGPVPIDELAGDPEEDNPNPHELIGDDFDLVSMMEAGVLRERIAEALESLNPKEAQVISLYFGLKTGEELTCKEVGEKLGLTRARVGQIIEEALHKLRHPRYQRRLRDFYRS